MIAPQMAQLTIIGTSSFAMMFSVDHSVDHSVDQGNWNHWVEKKAPHPHEPDASV